MNKDAENTVGVVLAGGMSQRMGSPKALLRCGSSTFLDSMAGALAQGGCRPIAAVISEPIRKAVLQECRLDGVDVIVNPDPALGPISSLRCALKKKPHASGIVWVLVDQGRVEVEAVRSVREALTKYNVVVARFRGVMGHPTGFSKKIISRLFTPIADRGAREIVAIERKSGRVGYVDVDDPGVIRNINTPEQYEQFVRRQDGE